MNKRNIALTICFGLMNFFVQAQTLKIMTYNIRLDVASDGENDWTHRKDFFNGQLQFYAPDIFGVQEAKPNQVLDIADALPQYGYVGIGRDGIGKGESSNIFYAKEKFKVIESSTFWLSDTPDVISMGWDAACNRVCTYALLKNVKNNKLIWIFNTHLDHIGEQARTKGLELILSRIEKLNKNKYPVILMGDFNSEPETERIIALKSKMDDARTVSKEKPFGPYGTFNNFKYNEGAGPLIDYIFISKGKALTVNKYAVLSDAKDLKYPSDHFPVFVEINYK
ncbi:endonuclease/exonuclease/phosphatase family protein [Flavobacterium aquicola]|uniref:Endonuclease/exonuclease/phosphatase family metal-dependent hydrolase n=1 Tax=Flavobacterium aquicola TaxID=1682742 RepID=A0A3E0EIL0_9FLAO|nr:endonuclease/exonuclease/phosphatase family protein [Flavobacterium aquicola]REG98084.1 endonuclease/exonuclease/phosphatase family metal-dependent hydrolase [Flavobacterium aquicola]